MGTTRTISLNTDIGEGYGRWRIADDEALLGLVTDANVACGFHAGDPDIMRATCAVAARNGVGIGAQVGFPDIRGFGRHDIDLPPDTVANDVLYQLGALDALARAEGTRVGYLKLHGALYHAAVRRPDYAAAIAGAVATYGGNRPVLCQPGTGFAAAVAAAGLATIAEGYLDRAYTPGGLLVPRGTPGAVLADPAAAVARAVQLAVHATVTSLDGTQIAMPVQSLCVHSDSPGAVELARAVRDALVAAGVVLAPLLP